MSGVPTGRLPALGEIRLYFFPQYLRSLYDGIRRPGRPHAPPWDPYLFCDWTAKGWLSPHVSIRFVELFCLSKLLSHKQNSAFPAYNFCSRFRRLSVYSYASPDTALSPGGIGKRQEHAGRCLGSNTCGWCREPLENEVRASGENQRLHS